jgi:hypothetical protein
MTMTAVIQQVHNKNRYAVDPHEMAVDEDVSEATEGRPITRRRGASTIRGAASMQASVPTQRRSETSDSMQSLTDNG